MLTWHNEPHRRDKMVASMAAHILADRLVAGATGGSQQKGCTVACAYQSVIGTWEGCYDHAGLADHLGVPQWVPRLADRIYEGLPKDDQPAFSQAWLARLPVGVDVVTSGLSRRLMAWVIRESRGNMQRCRDAFVANRDKIPARIYDARQEVDKAVSHVWDLIDRALGGDVATPEVWNAAAGVCRTAAWAAWAAWAAGAAGAAWAAVADRADRADWGAGAAVAAVAALADWADRAAWDAGSAAAAGAAWADWAALTAGAAVAAWDACRLNGRQAYFRALADELLRGLDDLKPQP